MNFQYGSLLWLCGTGCLIGASPRTTWVSSQYQSPKSEHPKSQVLKCLGFLNLASAPWLQAMLIWNPDSKGRPKWPMLPNGQSQTILEPCPRTDKLCSVSWNGKKFSDMPKVTSVDTWWGTCPICYQLPVAIYSWSCPGALFILWSWALWSLHILCECVTWSFVILTSWKHPWIWNSGANTQTWEPARVHFFSAIMLLLGENCCLTEGCLTPL